MFSFSCSVIEALVNKTFPILLGRLGDSAPRVVQQASETILEVLKNNSLEVIDTLPHGGHMIVTGWPHAGSACCC